MRRRRRHRRDVTHRRAPALGLAGLVMVLIAVTTACTPTEDPNVAFLAETDGGGYDGVAPSSERIEELRGEIERYEEAVQETTLRLGRIASYRKLLAKELMEAEMYGPALESLQVAMELQTENAVLYYLAGVAAARSARSGILSGEEEDRFLLAERMYREALNIRPDYREALYGLAVLLAFELDQPEEALEFAERLAQIETGDPAVKFLYANTLVRNGRTEDARAVYADLARSAPAEEQRRRAMENREALEERP